MFQPVGDFFNKSVMLLIFYLISLIITSRCLLTNLFIFFNQFKFQLTEKTRQKLLMKGWNSTVTYKVAPWRQLNNQGKIKMHECLWAVLHTLVGQRYCKRLYGINPQYKMMQCLSFNTCVAELVMSILIFLRAHTLCHNMSVSRFCFHV